MNKNTLRSFLVGALLFCACVPVNAQISFRAATSATATGITPAFRSAASATTTSATLTITKPSGVSANDVLIASIALTPYSVAITPPSGWTLIRRMDNAGPTSNSLAVYYKVATASEPASYAFGVSGAAFSVGGVQAFTGVDTAAPIDAEGGQSTPSALAHATPSITTRMANTIIVTSHAFASGASWTPPSGMTESFDRPSSTNNATGMAIEGNRVLQAVAGVTGTKTATASGNADTGNTHILALKPRGVSLSLATPAGVQVNDIMIAAVGFTNASAAVTAPSGWTLVRRINNANTTSNALAVYRRSAQAGEPTSQSFLIAGGVYLVGGIQAFSGVDSANPIDAENGQSTPLGTAHDTPSIVTGSANTMLVTAHTYASSNTWTPQAGLNEAFDRPSGATSASGQSITGGYQILAAVGASGTKRSTAAASADVGNTHILALRRFVPNSPPVVSLTSPANGSTYTPPATITLTAIASDADGTIQKVEFFHGGTNLIGTVTNPPYTFNWGNVPMGIYSLSAKATDNAGAATSSSPVSVTVTVQQAIYFVHPDHLNTPRVISDQNQQVVWRWDNSEPFGANVADEDPDGNGIKFTCNLRFPGQYFDKETGNHYNYFRDYSPEIGRYVESDPIGLRGGINTYAYVGGNPLNHRDAWGLYTELIAWDPVGIGTSSFGHLSTNINGRNYSFAPNGWDTTYPDAESYAQRQMLFRAGRGVVLDISPEQEAALEACLANSTAPYSATSNNCANPPSECLKKIGVSPRGFYPDQIVRYLRDLGPSTGNTFYPGPYSSPQDSGAFRR